MKKYGKKIIKKFLILCLFALLIFSSIVGKIIHDAPEISPRKLLEEVRNMPYAIAYEEIPPKMIAATLAAEDHRFYQHHGIDYIRIIQAILYDIYYGKLVYGASTIPMQLSKNHFTGFEKTFRRKILDMYYATVIEKELTKEEILECYLNTIGLSKGIVGVREGAKTFFNRDANQLSTAECVYLIGITNWPAHYTPILLEQVMTPKENHLFVTWHTGEAKKDVKLWESLWKEGKISEEIYQLLLSGNIDLWSWKMNPDTKYRQEYILKRMLETKSISQEEYEAYLKENIQLEPVNLKILNGKIQ